MRHHRGLALHEQLLAALPFTLTAAQRRVCEEIAHDMARSRPMHRLPHGDVGAGQRAKLVNNALMAANMGLAHAALGAAAALGIEREALVELIRQSSGRSFGFEVYARLPAPAAFAHGAALLVKDVNLLKRVLPDEQGAETLRAAASNFLSAATGG